jgi:hypothetical protein
VVTAASSASISRSSNHFSAPAKSLGKKWRCCEARLSGPALPFGTAEGPAAVTVGIAESRSGVVSVGRRVGIPPTMPPAAHRGNSWRGRPSSWLQTGCLLRGGTSCLMRGVKVLTAQTIIELRCMIVCFSHVWTNCTVSSPGAFGHA